MLSICNHDHLPVENVDSYKRTRNNSSIPKTLFLFSLICLLFLFTTPIPGVCPDPSGLYAVATNARQAKRMTTARLRTNPSKRSL